MANQRLPDNVHKMKGNYRPSRHGKPEEKLELPPKIPVKPKCVTGEAATEWRRITRILKKQGLITLLDRAILTQYCLLWAKLVESRYELSAADHAQLRITQQELGFTPSSRGKIVIKNKQDKKGFVPV